MSGAAKARLIDLTHPLRNDMPVWPGHPVFQQTVVSSFEKGNTAGNHSVCLSEHTGTHFDAPYHFVPDGRTIDRVPLERFFGRLLTIDATAQVADSDLPPGAILAFEAAHGPIKPGDAVMFRYGWDVFWEHPTNAARFSVDWPGLSRTAAELLVNRGVRLAGTDCLSIDRAGSTTFDAHHILLGADILIGENFANLGLLPPICRLTALPLPIEGGTGSPVRAVAHVDDGNSELWFGSSAARPNNWREAPALHAHH